MRGGVGVDPDYVPVEVSHDGRQSGQGDVPLHSLGRDVVAGVGPGVRVTTRQTCNESRHGTATPLADMLLIKPSWWARPAPAPTTRWTYPGHDTPKGSGDSRVQVTGANPASQPQASHHEHLQAVQSAHRTWLGINPAMCLKNSDAPPARGVTGPTARRFCRFCVQAPRHHHPGPRHPTQAHHLDRHTVAGLRIL
jgi:hypothetical protein